MKCAPDVQLPCVACACCLLERMNADGVADEGRVSTASVDEDYMNIDSNAFAVDKYVVALLQYKSLEEISAAW